MKGRGLVPTPSSTRILFGDKRTAGIGEGDREDLLLEASADANVERCEKVLCVLSPEGRRWMYSNMEPSGDLLSSPSARAGALRARKAVDHEERSSGSGVTKKLPKWLNKLAKK